MKVTTKRFTALTVGVALSALTLTGCGVPESKNPAPNPSGSGSPAATTPTYNAFDAAAVLGAFALVRQIPDDPTTRGKFLTALKASKETPKKPQVDMAVNGNRLVEYAATGDKNAPVCFAVSPLEAKETPTQAIWVAYFMPPKTEDGQALLLLLPGVTTCAQAAAAATQLSEAEYEKVSTDSMLRIRDAVTSLPAMALSGVGLALLDEARDLGAPPPSGSAASSGSGSPAPAPSTTPTPAPSPAGSSTPKPSPSAKN